MSEARYYFSDPGHVHDTQPDSAFRNVHGNWRAEYDAGLDAWHVYTPSGLYREYRRVAAS